eukprot:Awhi_evm1s9018
MPFENPVTLVNILETVGRNLKVEHGVQVSFLCYHSCFIVDPGCEGEKDSKSSLCNNSKSVSSNRNESSSNAKNDNNNSFDRNNTEKEDNNNINRNDYAINDQKKNNSNNNNNSNSATHNNDKYNDDNNNKNNKNNSKNNNPINSFSNDNANDKFKNKIKSKTHHLGNLGHLSNVFDIDADASEDPNKEKCYKSYLLGKLQGSDHVSFRKLSRISFKQE